MNWLFPSIVASLCGTIILTATYFYLFSIDRNRSLAIWGAGWGVYALRFILMLLLISETLGSYRSPLLIANQLAALVSGLVLLWGTFRFVAKKCRTSGSWFPVSLRSGSSGAAQQICRFSWSVCPPIVFSAPSTCGPHHFSEKSENNRLK